MADWATISALATAGGTLVLAGATFAAVRSGNRSARVAERSLLAGLRPLLVSSRRDDPPQKIHFADGNYLLAPGGGAALEATGEAVYLGLALRNAGSGIAVLHGWRLYPGELRRADEHAPLEEFTRLTRDLFIPPGDVGYWQGTFRDRSAPEFAAAREAIDSRQESVVEILYGDEEGGQRRISRFGLIPRDDVWIAEPARHWNIDGTDPRQNRHDLGTFRTRFLGFDVRMLSFQRARRLAATLDLDVDRTPICLMCLLDVALALHAGDEPQTRGATVRLTPDLWDEGLESPLRLALERACDDGVPDGRQALDDIDRSGPRTTIARAVVRRLAHQLNVRVYAASN